MAKVIKVIELLSGIAKKLGGCRAERNQRSEQDSPQHSFPLRQGDDRCGRERKDHQLPAQFESDSGTGRYPRR